MRMFEHGTALTDCLLVDLRSSSGRFSASLILRGVHLHRDLFSASSRHVRISASSLTLTYAFRIPWRTAQASQLTFWVLFVPQHPATSTIFKILSSRLKIQGSDHANVF